MNRAPVPFVSERAQSFRIPFFQSDSPVTQMKAMGTSGTLFAIVDKCATGAAAVDWHLYRKAASGKEEDRTEVKTHAALDLWNRPNGFFTRQEFVETVQQHHELTGEMWWVLARDPRSPIPLELWPVRPDRMEPVPNPRNYLSGYVYHGPDGEEVPLGLDEVIFVRRPNPMDPYRGISPVAAALAHIEAARFATEWNRNFFRNSAEPGGVIRIERKLSDPEFRQFRMRWAEQHQGVAAAHRVALLEGGAEWVERKYTQKDMQFVELRSATREDIREAFGFPKPLLGAVDDVNRANAEAAEYVFSKWVLVPRLERMKGALNADLLPLFGADDLEFDYDSPVNEDDETANASRDSRVAAAEKLITLGFEPAAVLDALELPELAFTPPPVPVAPPPVEPAEEGQQALPPGRRGAPAAARHDPRDEPDHWHTHGRHGDECAACRAVRAEAEDREDWEDRLDDLLDRWADEVTPGQIDALVNAIEVIVDQGTPEALAQLSVPIDVAEGILADAMLDQAEAAGRRMADLGAEQGVSISPVTPWPIVEARLLNAKAKPATYNADLAADLRAASRVQTSYLGQGLAAFAGQEALHHWQPGSAGTDVASAVRARLESLQGQGLRHDLGSQVWAAENEGRFATLEKAAEDLDVSVHYVADEVRDKNTCSACKDVDGTRYTKLGAAQADYPFGGYIRCDGRSRCRGTVKPVWD